MKTIWFDTETTGVKRDYDEIITLAGCIVDDDPRVEHIWFDYRMCCDVSKLSDSAIAVHGITREQVATFLQPKVVLQNFLNLLYATMPIRPYAKKHEKYCVAGYNVSFDVDMLGYMLEKYLGVKLVSYINYMKLDVFALVQAKYVSDKVFRNLPKHNLGAMCEFFDIPLDAHDARADITATRELYNRLK